MSKELFRYVTVLLVFGVGALLLIATGARLHSGESVRERSDQSSAAVPNAAPQEKAGASAAAGDIGAVFSANLRQPMSVLLLQVIVILLAARVVGALLQKVGQPAVIGERIAGILLGSSLECHP